MLIAGLTTVQGGPFKLTGSLLHSMDRAIWSIWMVHPVFCVPLFLWNYTLGFSLLNYYFHVAFVGSEMVCYFILDVLENLIMHRLFSIS